MSPSALALLISALCASGSSADGDALAANSIQVPLEFIEDAMPPPPTKVVLKTTYYGTVTLDHPAHLKRRIRCRECHGPGPVSQITFTAKLAHERCRGCHEVQAKGPTECRGCHVMPPKAPATVVAEASPPATATSPVASPNALGVAAGPPPAPVVPPEVVAAFDSERTAREFHRTVQVGASAGNGYGLSARLASRQGSQVLSFGLDRLGGNGPTRTTVLIGAGARLPVKLPPELELFGEGVAGLDALSSPDVELMLGVGGRVGLEWTPAWSRQFPFFFAVTGLMDAFHDGLLSPACLYASIGVGAALQRR